MFGFTFPNAGLFAKYLNCVKILNAEAAMEINPDRIYFNLMDPLHITMITLTLPVETKNIEKSETVNIKFDDIWSIFKEADMGHLSLECESKKATWTLNLPLRVKRQIIANMDDPILEECREPKIVPKNEVAVSSSRLMRELSEFTEHTHITLFLEEGYLVLYSEEEETVKKNFIKTDEIQFSEDVCIATYTAQYLLDYVEALSAIFDRLKISWSKDELLFIEGGTKDLKGGESYVRYVIAPCIGMTPKMGEV